MLGMLPANRLGAFPRPGTSLIGRNREVAAASALLLRADVPLLTPIGLGGVGKTRLAVEILDRGRNSRTGSPACVALTFRGAKPQSTTHRQERAGATSHAALSPPSPVTAVSAPCIQDHAPWTLMTSMPSPGR
jgi:hypothetical protein